MKKLLIIAGVVIIILVIFLKPEAERNKATAPEETATETGETMTPSETDTMSPDEKDGDAMMPALPGGASGGEKSYMVTLTASGFSPATLTIKQGEIVTFINETDKASWPASAVHPSHTVYPGSGIQKCKTSEANMIFDACVGLKKGETYAFTFNEVGEWGYHDHLAPALRGKIIVTE